MMTSIRTESEAIAAIRAVLYQRMRNAERFYDQAQREFPIGSVERREARAVWDETREAYRTVKQIAETATGPVVAF